ncbi:uncharacterized protein LOC106877564 [Octopus bimaculoides]|uniref:Uncharacterized protein n=1 Tax=Octopus bimaculoides TaxID=37653 RepID=A0A0L8GDL4_OCTBM|nr:uncharacterized protein LOC106877564 [Octopus bimaculoides]|eukprot:XP_014781988.1 PREDICTED: uncharacterized protein LOC106877564 [Octopus bimaculoides]
MTSNSNDEYLMKFLNTELKELNQHHIDHIALRLKENNLFNDHDWLEKSKLLTEGSSKYSRFFWKLFCLLRDPKTAKSTFDTIVNSLHDCELWVAHNLEFADSTCNRMKNNMEILDAKQNIVAKIELDGTQKLFIKPMSPELINQTQTDLSQIKRELFFFKATN